MAEEEMRNERWDGNKSIKSALIRLREREREHQSFLVELLTHTDLYNRLNKSLVFGDTV